MKKATKFLVSLLMVFIVIVVVEGCSLLEMTGEQRQEFAQDCLNKGLLVQITIDPLNNEQVQVECVPRVIFVPPSPPVDVHSETLTS